jgi:hypothetical protein
MLKRYSYTLIFRKYKFDSFYLNLEYIKLDSISKVSALVIELAFQILLKC